MANIEELKQQELEQLNNNETFSLESLITEGTELRIPITFDFPTKNGMKKASAIIRPVTSSEWETAQNYAIRNKKDFMLKILEKGLLNDNEEPLPYNLLQVMPFGVVNQIYLRIADVSGVKVNQKEQYEFTKELMGF